MIQRYALAFLFSFAGILPVTAQKSQVGNAGRMQWFHDSKLGIFIHWGIYAVNGIDESWSFYNGYISYPDYLKQLAGFTAAKYNPAEWASLIRESGAKYAVLTSKHHDGVALWDSKADELTVVKKTPAAKDLISPFCSELRKNAIKVGLYFSLLDWSHPDYPNFTKNEKRYSDDSVRWRKFTDYNFTQLREIEKNFNPDLWWFDGDWEQSAEKWKATEIREMILKNNSGAIINSRLQGYGDYATPEQGLPVNRPADRYWELCMTVNDSWGYQQNDHNFKSPSQVISIFSECLSNGGNLLLDIGPKADGSIPQEDVNVLRTLGGWIRKHSEAVYGTEGGLPPGFFHGPTTVSSDSAMLYLFFPGNPGGEIMLEGVKNHINRIYVVGNGTKLEFREYLRPYWSSNPGVVFIKVPDSVIDEYMTVLAVVLDGKLKIQEKD
ncbi:MAG TPA: alpha-L-fucosidase [Bacteroidales bacterium]|nr:alpha-L-fucosidase [Bacteroidales bacterium]